MVPADSEQPLAQLILKVVQLFQGVLASTRFCSAWRAWRTASFSAGMPAVERQRFALTERPLEQGRSFMFSGRSVLFSRIQTILNLHHNAVSPLRADANVYLVLAIVKVEVVTNVTVLFAAVLKGRRPSNQRAGSKGR